MKRFLIITITGFLIFQSCHENLPIPDRFGETKYSLLTQDSNIVIFPDFFKDEITVIGYIFTNCPDICPLTTNNMRMIQSRVHKEGLQNVRFVSLSFDPEFDHPSVLKRYAELRNLDQSDWTFLTGDKATINSLIKEAGVVAIPGNSIKTSRGETIHFYIHTDRISIIDADGNIVQNYLGSSVNVDEVVYNIKLLSD